MNMRDNEITGPLFWPVPKVNFLELQWQYSSSCPFCHQTMNSQALSSLKYKSRLSIPAANVTNCLAPCCHQTNTAVCVYYQFIGFYTDRKYMYMYIHHCTKQILYLFR